MNNAPLCPPPQSTVPEMSLSGFCRARRRTWSGSSNRNYYARIRPHWRLVSLLLAELTAATLWDCPAAPCPPILRSPPLGLWNGRLPMRCGLAVLSIYSAPEKEGRTRIALHRQMKTALSEQTMP